MASHPLLRSPEILRQLCTVLAEPILTEYDDGSSYENRQGVSGARRTLFAMLLTCRSFMPVALDTLWKMLPYFDPLLNVLGYDEDKPNVAESALDWTRFEWYARHVKSICLGTKDTYLPSFILNHTPLLPNLCTLRWDHECLDLVPLFFVPSLQYFAFSMRHSDEAPWLQEIHSCFNSLIASPARLQHLRLNGCDARISSQLIAFRQLRDLALPYQNLSSEVWHNLAAIPNLERLEINYMDDCQRIDTARAVAFSSTTGLRSLKYLEMTGIGCWNSVLSVLRDLPSTHIQHVYFQHTWYHEPEPDYLSEWRDLARILSTKGVHCFEVSHWSDLGDNGPALTPDGRVLEPLFTFAALEDLQVDFCMPGHFAITDDDIRRLALALPRLTKLRVAFPEEQDTCLTVQSLVHIATTSSALEDLQIDISIEKDGISLLPDPEDVPYTSCPLKEITLGLRPVPPHDASLRRQKVDTLARILDRLFPELESMDWEDEEIRDLFMD